MLNLSLPWTVIQMATLSALLMMSPKAFAENILPAASGETDQPIPGIVQPACPGQDQGAMNRCAGRWRQLTEWFHEQMLDAQMNSLLPQEVVKLIDAEIAWQEFRDSHCNLISRQVIGGSLYPFVLDSCMAHLTNERMAALQAWGERPPSLDEVEQRLQSTYQNLAIAMNPLHLPQGPQPALSQHRWELYRQEHCAFEVMVQTGDVETGATQIAERCQARLAAERVAHLERLSEIGW